MTLPIFSPKGTIVAGIPIAVADAQGFSDAVARQAISTIQRAVADAQAFSDAVAITFQAGAHLFARSVGDAQVFTDAVVASFISGAAPVTFPYVETWSVPDVQGDSDGDHIWNDFIGTHRWEVFQGGNRLVGATSVTQGGNVQVDLGVSDYRVSVTLRDWQPRNPGILSIGPMVRMPGGNAVTGYAFAAQSINGLTGFRLFKFVDGQQEELAVSTGTPAVASVVTVDARGPRLLCLHNGTTIFDYTDVGTALGAPLLTGRFVGRQGFIG